MDLTKIATISGKSGLFRIIKPTRTGMVLESLDEQKKRSIASANSRVSVLGEISIYTTDAEGSKPLGEVLKNIYQINNGAPLDIAGNSREEDLRSFMEEAEPIYDQEKVYLSDIKKLALWYNILVQFAPEIFADVETEEKAVEKTDESLTEEKHKEEDSPNKTEPDAEEE